jgi:hypothetical protein
LGWWGRLHINQWIARAGRTMCACTRPQCTHPQLLVYMLSTHKHQHACTLHKPPHPPVLILSHWGQGQYSVGGRRHLGQVNVSSMLVMVRLGFRRAWRRNFSAADSGGTPTSATYTSQHRTSHITASQHAHRRPERAGPGLRYVPRGAPIRSKWHVGSARRGRLSTPVHR